MPNLRDSHSGFTLIELIMVIVILGILSALAIPRFADLGDSARASVVNGTGAAFQSGIHIAHSMWLVQGTNGPIDNLQVYGSTSSGQLDINSSGWPAQNWPPFESNPTLGNVADCISVWQTIIEAGGPTVATGSTADFDADYSGSNSCLYKLTEDNLLGISYNSNTGVVTIDDDPSS